MGKTVNPNIALTALSSSYFILAVSSLSVIGLLVPMAESLAATESEIAYLVAIFSITNALAAPLLQTVVGNWDRRRLILFGLLLMATGTALQTRNGQDWLSSLAEGRSYSQGHVSMKK